MAKAEKERNPTGSRLKKEPASSVRRKSKLRMDGRNAGKYSAAKSFVRQVPITAASSGVHQAVSEQDSDNADVEAVQFGEQAAETAMRTMGSAGYSKKLKVQDEAQRFSEGTGGTNAGATYQRGQKENPKDSSNLLSKWKQKQNIKKEYAAARAGKSAGTAATAKGSEKAAKGAAGIGAKLADWAKTHPQLIALILVFSLLVVMICGMASSCSMMFQGGGNVVLGTSYTAEDADILGTDEDYTAMETELRQVMERIKADHPGYDEYRYQVDEINHNPYELASYLTVVFEDYTREEVQDTLEVLFEKQYELTLREEVQIRTRTETYTGINIEIDYATGETYEVPYEYEVEVEYEYYILHVTLKNHGLGTVVEESGLDTDQMERYQVLMETLGNRSYLFGDNPFSVPGEVLEYDIPGEALTDTAFANMIREGEKYLGKSFVWGGSTPSTGFDCSGFVSWVINYSGNGWDVGRQTANGLKNTCDIIPSSEAKPGDLIFFKGTYDTAGASHVGIYVGDGMMLHCGNPISYASIETNYWQEHFYCYGRLP